MAKGVGDCKAGLLTMLQSAHDIEEISALGIHVVSLHEGVDTSTPNGRLVVGIFASISEVERELIRSRIRSGLAAARAKGKHLGPPADHRRRRTDCHSARAR